MRIRDLLPFPDSPPPELTLESDSANRPSYYRFFTKYFDLSFLRTLPLLTAKNSDEDFLDRRLHQHYRDDIKLMTTIQLKKAAIDLLDDYANSFWLFHPNRHYRVRARALIAELKSKNFASAEDLIELIQQKMRALEVVAVTLGMGTLGSYFRPFLIKSACAVAARHVNALFYEDPRSYYGAIPPQDLSGERAPYTPSEELEGVKSALAQEQRAAEVTHVAGVARSADATPVFERSPGSGGGKPSSSGEVGPDDTVLRP